VSKEKVIQCDVLVIGGGIAGGFAALKAHDSGAKVVVVDKGFVSRSGQSPYVDGHLVFNPEWGDDLEAWMAMINRVGEYLNQRDWTKVGLVESYARFCELVSWGVEFARNPDGTWYRRPNPLGAAKTMFMPPRQIPNVLREQMKARGIQIVDRHMVYDLIQAEGRVVGAIGFGWKDYALTIFECKAVVLATGASGLKGPQWPIHMLTGDGDAMAYRAGAAITGKEFMDPHFTNAEHPAEFNWNFKFGGRRLEDLGPPLGRLVNARGENVPRRGTLFLELEFEAHAGNAPLKFYPNRPGLQPITQVGGGALGMSIHKAEGVWARDLHGWSGVPGLYAAGDALGSMASGAVYAAMGLSSANCGVTGARAGIAAAEYAKSVSVLSPNAAQVNQLREKILAPTRRQGGFTPRWLIAALQNHMAPYYVLMVKRHDRLAATLTFIEFVRDHLVPKVYATDPHELRLAHEVSNMVLNSEMRLRAGLWRTESRGCHYREDYPFRDDTNWLAWILIRQKDGQMVLEKEPVPEAWRPDPRVPYTERYEWRLPGEAAFLSTLNSDGGAHEPPAPTP
jgi:succinate dehydrogenase/fumarate reductase flavoprotein subunit